MLYYKAQIYGLFVITALLLMCWIGIKKKEKENKIFIIILLSGFFNLIFDIVTNYTVNHLETVSPVLNRIVHGIFFFSLTNLFMLVYKYLVALVEKELEEVVKGKVLTTLPYVVFSILEFVLPLYYVETSSGNYSYGVAVYMLYICVAIYVVLIIELVVHYRKIISAKNKIAVTLALVSVAGTSVFQMIVPAALTSSLGVILFCLCMYMTVENPDAILAGLLKRETERADAANRAKSEFLARMSHEIRTPINAVLGMNEMVLRETKEPETKQYARDIKGAARALLSLINEILDSSKIESGKMELVLDNYEISSLFNDLYSMIGVKAKEKDLKLVFQIDPSIPSEYYGDDIRIRQVIMNLLTNAIKYTETGTVTLTVTGKTEGENAILHCGVKDTGIGIKEEDLEKLFKKYERIEEQRNRHVEGTGLGMNIVVQLLALMGSALRVQSTYGEGSEFSFDLVQKVVNPEPLGDFQSRIIKETEEIETGESYVAPDARILIVDDNEMNRKVFRNLLKRTQIVIYGAQSGEECIELMKQQEFDMVFLDYMMPGMDGVETLHALREKDLCKDIPIIMLTANAVVGAREQYLKEGFRDYLTKPIHPEKLDKMILEYLPGNLIKEDAMFRGEEVQEADLPQLDEFDFEYAMNLLRSKEVLLKMLEDFYDVLGRLPQKLSSFYSSADEETRTQYRIEVHALKSTSATVGALLLSKLARLLEVAAANNDRERMDALHPILLAEMKLHRERIATILQSGEDCPALENMEEVLPYFAMLQQNLENDDYDAADFVMENIKKYRYPEELEEAVQALSAQVMDLDAETALQTIAWIQGKERG